MKRVAFSLLGLLVAGAAGWTAPAAAEWPDDPAVNLAIAGYGDGEQVVPKIAAAPDGGCYVGWYDNARAGNYDVYLQRLDAAGVEQWAHDGLCVSAHPQNSWVTDWDLICDAEGNAIVAFNDVRDGADWDVFVYKVSPSGAQLWGADGQAVSDGNPDDEVAPALTQATDGDIVVAWTTMGGDGFVLMQRIAPDGAWRFPGPVAAVTGEGSEAPAFVDLVPSLQGDVIVSYVRDISMYMSPRHFRAWRISPAGAPVWPSYVAIADDGALPMGYAPTIQSDGAGGLVTAWHRADGTHLFAAAQRVSAGGVEAFPHNGVRVSLHGTQHHIDPSYSFDPATGNLFVFWNERNSNQSAWGIYGQRLSAAGARQWGDNGLVILPVDAVEKSYPRSAQVGADAVLFVADATGGSSSQARLRAWRFNAAGTNVWPAPALVSSSPSTKNRLPLCVNGSGMAVIVWEDDRNGSPDVYGQNVNADGTLGFDPTAVEESAAGTAALRLVCAPNPSTSSVRLDLALRGRMPGAVLGIYDAAGSEVRRMRLGDLGAGDHAFSWDGRDAAGRAVAGGVYFARLHGAGGSEGTSVRLVRAR